MQAHGHRGEGLSDWLRMSHWPSLTACVWRVGWGSAHDSCVVWTLAGLRCLKHLRRVGPKSWAALFGFSEFLEDLA